MNVIILGDKFQKRMKSKGSVGLLKINKDYLIVKQYRAIKKFFPDSKIVYVYGFDSKRFVSVLDNEYKDIKDDIEFLYNKEYDSNNYGYSLELAKHYLEDDTLVLFGYTILSNNILNQINIQDKISKIFITNNNENKLGCVIHNNRIENIFYDLDNKLEDIYFLTQTDAIILQKILNDKNIVTKNMFIFEFINKLIDNNVCIKPILSTAQNRGIKCRQKF
jgi:choline kinase